MYPSIVQDLESEQVYTPLSYGTQKNNNYRVFLLSKKNEILILWAIWQTGLFRTGSRDAKFELLCTFIIPTKLTSAFPSLVGAEQNHNTFRVVLSPNSVTVFIHSAWLTFGRHQSCGSCSDWFRIFCPLPPNRGLLAGCQSAETSSIFVRVVKYRQNRNVFASPCLKCQNFPSRSHVAMGARKHESFHWSRCVWDTFLLASFQRMFFISFCSWTRESYIVVLLKNERKHVPAT